MDRAAIFVDAGYLFAQGSTALMGSKQPRTHISLDPLAVLNELSQVVASRTAGSRLLRTYWYDGAINFKGPTIEQAKLAHLDNVKVRLGFINSAGEQKGVDSLIVTDLIELARLGAICDAVLLSGDEDVRVGVQIAQNYGVRVHLIGIFPARGSQSRALQQESDTTTEWDKGTVEKFLTIRSPAAPTLPIGPIAAQATDHQIIQKVAEDIVATLVDGDLRGIHSFWKSARGVPPEFDGKLLAICRSELKRELTTPEKRHVRSKFSDAVKLRAPS